MLSYLLRGLSEVAFVKVVCQMLYSLKGLLLFTRVAPHFRAAQYGTHQLHMAL